MTSPSSYYDGIRREAAAAGRAVREALRLPPAKTPPQAHCRTCGRALCSRSDAKWSARA